MDTFTRRFGLPRPHSESQAQTAIGNLILQSSTGMAMAPGISVAARDKRMNPNQPQAVRDEDMHPYYKPHLKNVDLADRIRRFHDSTQDKMSRVWAIDCCAKQGEVVLNGPFTSKGRLHQFIIDSERKPKDSRIFVADGTNSWSAALIGRECKVPVEFFLDSTDEQYVHLKPRKDMEAGCPVTMDNARIATIATRFDVSHRSIRFEALGNSEIQFQRSHIFFGNLPQWSRKTAVVLCNESHEYPLGEALVDKLMKDATKSERLCQDILWLMWDVYKEMNNWPHILELMKHQLTIEEKHAEHPELDLTEALHKDTAIHIELHEMIRVQIAVLDGFINTVTQKNPLLRSPAITQILDTKARLKRSQDVLEVLTKQTNNLISQVYNFMAIRESTSVGKLTWITLIYLPLSFAASLFSMSIQQLDPRPSVWAYVSFALVLSAITLAVAAGSTSVFQHRKKVLKEIHSYIHPTSSKLERVVVDQDIRSYRKSNVEEPGTFYSSFTPRDETTMDVEEKKKKYQELIHNLKAPPKPYSLINVQYHSKSQYATTENNPGPVSLDLALSTRQDEILSGNSQSRFRLLPWSNIFRLQPITVA
ncbi:hypothetical protein BZA77DRAFT_34718 [Pyronema omphalodes]|nr:hypothetical protein BZA77DRAFT_34718 [Pyronema omphalodes]